MKNLFETIATFLVLCLSLLMVFLIVQYNLVNENVDIEELPYAKVLKSKASLKDKRNSYLQNLEGYTDVDVNVDAQTESMTNTVIIKSELHNDAIKNTVDDYSKSSYMENLNKYSETSKDENLDTLKPVNNGIGEPEKLEQEEVEDTIGMAIDALLDE